MTEKRIQIKTPIGELFAVYDAEGNEIPGYLKVDDEGWVRFYPSDPDSEKE
jgi:hypothetical protein